MEFGWHLELYVTDFSYFRAQIRQLAARQRHHQDATKILGGLSCPSVIASLHLLQKEPKAALLLTSEFQMCLKLDRLNLDSHIQRCDSEIPAGKDFPDSSISPSFCHQTNFFL